jgi:hypothetical protein
MLPRTPRGGLPKRRDRMPPAAMRPTPPGAKIGLRAGRSPSYPRAPWPPCGLPTDAGSVNNRLPRRHSFPPPKLNGAADATPRSLNPSLFACPHGAVPPPNAARWANGMSAGVSGSPGVVLEHTCHRIRVCAISTSQPAHHHQVAAGDRLGRRSADLTGKHRGVSLAYHLPASGR